MKESPSTMDKRSLPERKFIQPAIIPIALVETKDDDVGRGIQQRPVEDCEMEAPE